MMCVAICYSHEKHIVITHFTHKKAKLPIRTVSGQIQLVLWGRRKEETGELPLGGWITHELLEKGHWDAYFPKKVKILVNKFMEYTIEEQCEWFDITSGFWLQGVLLHEKNEQRVYIVTITPEMPNTPFSRWPVIQSN